MVGQNLSTVPSSSLIEFDQLVLCCPVTWSIGNLCLHLKDGIFEMLSLPDLWARLLGVSSLDRVH